LGKRDRGLQIPGTGHSPTARTNKRILAVDVDRVAVTECEMKVNE
jgi:hypothetical protein